MALKPILIFQMHRMGDLILSFPLFLWLHREYPGHPLWVVGEQRFYNALMPISPEATYMPWDAASNLHTEQFILCINLSHDSAAAALAGKIRAEKTWGAVEVPARGRYVHGNWQLYRTGLVHANRHNCFHWADLNALDCIPLKRIRTTTWPRPRTGVGDGRRIGLFLGASEPAKRPAPTFWAVLVRELLHHDLRPILLGGPAEMEMAEKVRKLSGQNVLNLAGRLNLAQLANLGQSLELLITPDTGPMHLAAWTGLHVLNLSMGPVNPWETGPYQPGHFVLQARMSCAGCWQCSRPGYFCHERYLPRIIARMTYEAVRRPSESMRALHRSGLGLLTSGRSPEGLYFLHHALCVDATPRARELLNRFWSLFWGALFGLWTREPTQTAWTSLQRAYPALSAAFVRSLADFRRNLRQAWDSLFWSRGAPLLRPLYSYMHLVLQNTDFSPAGKRQAMKIVEELLLIVVEKEE
ncbi:MAG TPA: glycosyltransferase family 9 protein [Desulfonatronum sp.]|nr:glycosyltransferase family 9 protein [Desulfonatronum sp.]